MDNKEALLSVLRGETVNEWGGGDVSAKDVWNYDVNPDAQGSYTASGALWTMWIRSDWLNNTWAPSVNERLDGIEDALGINRHASPPPSPVEENS